MHERFAAPGQGFVRIYNIVGSVKVTGWDKDSIAVIGSAWIGPKEGFIMHRGPDGTKLGVWDESLDASKPSHLEVYVPAKSSVWVKTGSAEVTVLGVTGSIDVSSTTGGIDVGGAPRDVITESMGGDIYLHVDTRSARAKTAGSNVRMRGTINDVVASTVSGNLVVENGVYERARLESVDGDVRYFGAIDRSASLEFVNHSGAVELNIPPTTWAEFAIDTYLGTVEQEFVGVLKPINSNVKAKRYTLVLGKGGPQVSIRTFKGGIFIRRKG
ncbi:MAG: DUF4097 family beta strand repeat-containing protein [Longimicrobiales bacterium]